MRRMIVVLFMLLVSIPCTLTSLVYLEPGEIAVNVGLKTQDQSSVVLSIIKDEFDGVLVKEIEDLDVMSFVLPEVELSIVRNRLEGLVEYVEPDRLRYIPELPFLIDNFFVPRTRDNEETGGGNPPLYYPNDPRYDQQWGPPAIDAQRAWNFVPQNHNVILAIVDTGIDMSHEDLTGNLDTSIDKDIVNNDNNADDDMGHGTHCAGIAAAVINNDKGIAGLAQVTLMGVKVLSWLGAGTDSDIADGINYAANNGADVISLSLGGTSNSTTIHNACNNAYNNHNVVVVAAAGNENTDQKTYPAAYSTVIGVAALATPTTRASFSNYGYDNVEISAPGQAIHSTLPDHLTFWNLFGIFPFDYGDMDGTSMACPHVAGVAAGYRAFRESLSAQAVRNLLNTWADDLGDDYYFGSGRLDYFPIDSKGSQDDTDVPEDAVVAVSDPVADTFIQFLRYRSIDVEVFDMNKKQVASFRRYTEDISLNDDLEPLAPGQYLYRLRAGDRVTSLRKVVIHRYKSGDCY